MIVTDELADRPFALVAVNVKAQLRVEVDALLDWGAEYVPVQLTVAGFTPDQKVGEEDSEQFDASVEEYERVNDPPVYDRNVVSEFRDAVSTISLPSWLSDRYFTTEPKRPRARTQNRQG